MEDNKYEIDGAKIEDKESLWKEVSKVLELPEYFGNNLDALADVLQEQDMQGMLRVIHEEQLIEKLGNYGKIFIEIITRKG